jgi:hypothetical protein
MIKIDASAVLGRDRAVQIDVFADEILRREVAPGMKRTRHQLAPAVPMQEVSGPRGKKVLISAG